MLCRRSAHWQASLLSLLGFYRYNRMAGSRHAPKIGSSDKSTTYYSGRAASRGAMVRRTPTDRLWLRTTAFPPPEAARPSETERAWIVRASFIACSTRRVAAGGQRVVRAARFRQNTAHARTVATGHSRAWHPRAASPMFHAARCSPGLATRLSPMQRLKAGP